MSSTHLKVTAIAAMAFAAGAMVLAAQMQGSNPDPDDFCVDGCNDSFSFAGGGGNLVGIAYVDGSHGYDEDCEFTTACYDLSKANNNDVSHINLHVCLGLVDKLVEVTHNGVVVPQCEDEDEKNCWGFGKDGSVQFPDDSDNDTFGFKIDPAPVGEYCFTFEGIYELGCTAITLKDGNDHSTSCITGISCVEGECGGDVDELFPHGCTPGYWKNAAPQGGGYSFWPADYEPSDPLSDHFTFPGNCSDVSQYANHSLLAALDFGGGSGVAGGARILLRAAVAGLLNAAASDADPDCWNLAYPWTVEELTDAVNAALASCNRATMIALADLLDADNNLGCPQDAHGDCIEEDGDE